VCFATVANYLAREEKNNEKWMCVSCVERETKEERKRENVLSRFFIYRPPPISEGFVAVVASFPVLILSLALRINPLQ
jgi:hypothetical protein